MAANVGGFGIGGIVVLEARACSRVADTVPQKTLDLNKAFQ
jgi:hypothetical protein